MNRALLSVGLASFVVVGGCQCIDDNGLNQLKDAGFPETDAGPPPPTFPLKAGDVLTIQQYGGRVNECGGGEEGACDRNIRATYFIDDVVLNDGNRWEIHSDFLFEGLSDTIPAAALARLAIENTNDFAAIEQGTSQASEAPAIFTTTKPPRLDSEYRANHFPFFQGENPLDDGDDGEVFAAGAAEFREAITAVDADAEVETQVAAGKFEAFFRDDIGGEVTLHKLLVEIHPMGFICGWDEILIPFSEGMARSQASFNGINNPPLTASFFPPSIARDGVNYQCSCFTRICSSGNGADRVCLDPTDPDAGASAEACNVD